MSGNQVVEHDDVVACARQGLGGVAANVPGPTGDQDLAGDQRPMEKYENPSARIWAGA